MAGSLIHCASSAKFFALTEGFVTSTSGASTAFRTGTKSDGFHRSCAKAAGLMVIMDCVPIHSVLPSVAFRAISALRLPLAPGRLSTMKVPPVVLLS